jgi:hypothetical protein
MCGQTDRGWRLKGVSCWLGRRRGVASANGASIRIEKTGRGRFGSVDGALHLEAVG